MDEIRGWAAAERASLNPPDGLDENLCQQVIEEEAEREIDEGSETFADWLDEQAGEQLHALVYAALRMLSSPRSDPLERIADFAPHASRLLADYIAYRRETMDDDRIAELVEEMGS